MGISSTSMRLTSQTLYISDLEESISQVTNKKQQIAYQASAIATTNPQMAAQLHLQDQTLNKEMLTLETQLKLATKDLDSIKKMQDDEIERGKVDIKG